VKIGIDKVKARWLNTHRYHQMKHRKDTEAMLDHRLLFSGSGAQDARQLLDRGQAHAARRQLTRTAEQATIRPAERRPVAR